MEKSMGEQIKEECYKEAQRIEKMTMDSFREYVNMTDEEREKMAWDYGLSDEAKKGARELGIL